MAVETLSSYDGVNDRLDRMENMDGSKVTEMSSISIQIEDNDDSSLSNNPEFDDTSTSSSLTSSSSSSSSSSSQGSSSLPLALSPALDVSSIYSPEISRHSLEQAHRRARVLEEQLKEELETLSPSSTTSITSLGQTVSSIAEGVVIAVKRVSRLAHGNGPNYSILQDQSHSASRTSSEVMEFKSETSLHSTDPHPQRILNSNDKIRSALKQLDVEKGEAITMNTLKSRARIRWSEDIDSAQLVEDEDDSKHRRVKGMIRRLSPSEKEALYSQRPDLRIIPNWAQKYREEMMQDRDSASNACIVCIVFGLLGILIFCIVVILLSLKQDNK